MTADNKINILVVDDLAENLVVMESVLAELGENIIIARSGEEALLKVLRHDFAVILMDVNMPMMSGYETATLIRKRRRSAHTPIIFITAYADEQHKALGYSLGAVDYILSPVNPDILRTKVRVFVELCQMAKRHADERVALIQEQAARLAAETAHRQSQFLADTSATLAASLDSGTTIRGLARLSVPFLADLSAVTLVSQRGELTRTELAWTHTPAPATAHLDPAALPAPLRTALTRVLHSGQMEHLVDLEVPAPSPGAGPPFALGAALILPLRAGKQILGIMSLWRAQSGRSFGPAEILLAGDLAGRAAVSLDNARLYRDIQEADTRKNEFLAMLAHELRNPLAAIRGAVHVLGLAPQGADKISWAQSIIDRQVTQLVRLVNDLLDMARITQGKIRLQLEPVQLAAVVELAKELSGPFIKARQHHLSVSCPAELLWVRGDAARLAQVLTNLLNNAAKYTDIAGEIGLRVERDGEQALLRVRDNGIGIPAEFLDRIFELFAQANRSLDRAQGGLGIGLTLVRHLVEMHGGCVSVHSAGPNQGSEFVVRLPLLTDSPVEPEPAAPPPPAAHPRRRVLVVDDNQDVAETLALLLEDQGQEVRVAHEGKAALAIAPVFAPQLVLLDIGLPGIDGYEVARRLRALPELLGARIVALTGYGQPEARSQANAAGIDLHLVKPVQPETLLELLHRPVEPDAC